MKKLLILSSVAAALSGCGSLTPALTSGQGFYSKLPQPEVARLTELGKTKTSSLETEAYGCFVIAPESVDKEIIEPAVTKFMTERNGIAAANVKATRQIAPTIADAITGGFIWACSYWNVTGDLYSSVEIEPKPTNH
jgi:hypothetical protein